MPPAEPPGIPERKERHQQQHGCQSPVQPQLHTTAEDLRDAAMAHPVEHLIQRIEEMLPGERIPFQWPPGERRVRVG